MSVTVPKPSAYLPTVQALLRRQIILPRLVTRKGIEDFRGRLDDTVNVKIQMQTSARTIALRATGAAREIIADNMTQVSYPVKLTTRAYNAIEVTEEELQLDLEDFLVEVVEPQQRAVAVYLENGIASTLAATTFKNTLALSTTDAQVTFNKVYRLMDEADVPDDGNRWIVCGTAMAEALRNDASFRNASAAGAAIASDALTRATIRDTNGMRVISSRALDPYVGYAGHPSAVIMAAAAPKAPRGVIESSQSTYEGFSMRAIMDYDPKYTINRSILESWVGFKSVTEVGGTDDGKMVRAVKLTLAPYGS